MKLTTILLLSILLFSSCETVPDKYKRCDYIAKIAPADNGKCEYYANMCDFGAYQSFIDTCGRYKVGDSIKL